MLTQDPIFEPAPTSPLYLVEEISHRVINEYCEAINSLALAGRSASAPVQVALASAADRLHAHAESHRALLPPWQDGTVDLADYIGRVCRSLSKASLADRGVEVAVWADETWLSADRCWRVRLIIAELVRNAARHGLAGRTGMVGVHIVQVGERIVCMVCDDGRGASEPRPGRGSRLVQTLAAALGGTVEWLFLPSGCLARLEVPATGPVSSGDDLRWNRPMADPSDRRSCA